MSKPGNQVVKKETTHMTVSDGPRPQSTVLSSDLLIPKVWLMQGLSELVSERKASQGDIVRSTTGEVLGGPDKPLEFIPLSYSNTWILTEKVGGKYTYRSQEPMTARNQDLPWDYQVGGTEWKRTKCLNLYALLPADIAREQKAVEATLKTGEMPDASIALMPVVISFRSTSYKAGKTVATHFANVESLRARYPQYAGMQSYSSTLKLTCYQDKNDLGSYYVFDVKSGSKTSDTNMQQASVWAQSLATQSHRVDDSDLTTSEGALNKLADDVAY